MVKIAGGFLTLAVCVVLARSASAQVPDHLKCYKVKDPATRVTYVADLEGLTLEAGCVIKVPAKLACVPATNTNVSPPPPGTGGSEPSHAFGCYKVRCPKATLPTLALNDQFGSRVVTPTAPKLLCAPVVSETTTTTTTIPLDPNLVMRWTFDGTLANSGQLDGHSMLSSGNSYGAGKFGQAAVIDAGRYLYVDGMRASLGTYSDVTIAFWLREPGDLSGRSVLSVQNRSVAPYGGISIEAGSIENVASVCVSTTTAAFLGGSCLGFAMPSPNTWHHWIVRYDGAGTGSGEGGPTQIYIDNVLVHTRSNDTNNNPVFSNGIRDSLYVGGGDPSDPGIIEIDDLRIYQAVSTSATQCTSIIGGSWNGSSCILP